MESGGGSHGMVHGDSLREKYPTQDLQLKLKLTKLGLKMQLMWF